MAKARVHVDEEIFENEPFESDKEESGNQYNLVIFRLIPGLHFT